MYHSTRSGRKFLSNGGSAVSQQEQIKTEDFYLYDKKVVCPLCKSTINVKAVRNSRLRLVKRDTDSMPVYQDINPLFYDVWLCNHCGYARLQNQFPNPVLPAEANLIRQNISSKWQPRDYPPTYSPQVAIERYKLALYGAMVREAKSSELGMLYLKLAWIYRSLSDQANEITCMQQACRYLEKAFQDEEPPVLGMDSATHMYLIGELHRRLGNFDKALRWFGEVLLSPKASKALKDKTRDQKDLVIEATKSTS